MKREHSRHHRPAPRLHQGHGDEHLGDPGLSQSEQGVAGRGHEHPERAERAVHEEPQEPAGCREDPRGVDQGDPKKEKLLFIKKIVFKLQATRDFESDVEVSVHFFSAVEINTIQEHG